MSEPTNQPLKISTPSSAADSANTVLSVEQLNLQIKQLIEGQVGTVWIRGEISNFKAHTSGHYYFSLKDAKSQISAVMFRGNNSRLKFKVHDGLEVVARGRVSVYEPRGNYQIVCDLIEPVGAGALQKAFEQLKEKLKLEGLFSSEKKRPLPTLPRKIAIVTSPTGAAIRDILNVLNRRAKSIEVIVVPTVVQGAAAAPQIVDALKMAYRIKDLDAIICGRGGGSTEDMWCFNDEALARVIASSPVPIVSAVGHEIDFTIADFVADVRAPTPSAAAEMIAKSSAELDSKIQGLFRLLTLSMKKKTSSLKDLSFQISKRLQDPRKKIVDFRLKNDDLLERLESAMLRGLQNRIQKINYLEARLGSPDRQIQYLRQKLKDRQGMLLSAFQRNFQQRQNRFLKVVAVMDSLSPLQVLSRGYAIVFQDKKAIRSAKELEVKSEVEIKLSQGSAKAQIISVSQKD